MQLKATHKTYHPVPHRNQSLMYHLIVQVVLFIVVFCLAYLWFNRHVNRHLRHLPGPAVLPLLGSSYIFLGKNSSEIFYTFQQLSSKYGGRENNPVRFYLGSIPFVIVSHPDHAQSILTSAACLEKPWIYRFTPLEGIFALPVEKWRVHRKAIQPSFNLAILKSFIPIFKSKVDILVAKLDQQTTKSEPFDVYEYIAACTLDMVYASTLGTEMNVQQKETCEYLNVFEELFELVTNRVANALLHPNWIYRLTGAGRREAKLRQIFQAPAREVLQNKPILSDSTERETVEHTGKPQIFIDQLYRISRKDPRFDRDTIEQELNTMIFGGNETTATTMANALLLIGMHTVVQRKLLAELEVVFGGRFEEISVEQLQQLNYIEAVLKEVMRLLPITTILGRKTTGNVKLGTLTIPPGVNLAIDVFNIHRNREHWGSDADLFVPERFLGDKHHPYAFLGFSAGPRNCIGVRYAWLSMKIMLAKVLWQYEITTPLRLQDISIKVAMTLKVVNKHMINVRRRNKVQCF